MRSVKPDVWMIRHGQTEWSATGRHTSTTEVPLTAAGESAADALAPALSRRAFALVLTSPRARARDTARRAGFPDAEVDPDLQEWNYGDFEGLTSNEIGGRGPELRDWTVWTGPLPGGETLPEVADRARRVIARADAAGGDVLLFGHGHQLRVLAAVALDLDPGAGARLMLDPATVSIIGSEHGARAIRVWNRD
jgi:broad specificity phosphatase PhoE